MAYKSFLNEYLNPMIGDQSFCSQCKDIVKRCSGGIKLKDHRTSAGEKGRKRTNLNVLPPKRIVRFSLKDGASQPN